MNISAFKLTSGEEIVAGIVDEHNTKYVISKPRILVLTPGEKGQMHISMIPWMVSAQDPSNKEEHDVMLYKDSIIGTPVAIPNPLKKGYIQNTSSIQLV